MDRVIHYGYVGNASENGCEPRRECTCKIEFSGSGRRSLRADGMIWVVFSCRDPERSRGTGFAFERSGSVGMVQIQQSRSDQTGVAGVEQALASEPPARRRRIWGRRPSGVDPSHP